MAYNRPNFVARRAPAEVTGQSGPPGSGGGIKRENTAGARRTTLENPMNTIDVTRCTWLKMTAAVSLGWMLSFPAAWSVRADEPAGAVAATVVDDFSDGDFTHNPPWTVQSGSFAVRNAELVFGTEKDATIHLDLGKVAWKTPLKARLKLRQTNASGQTSFLFGLALSDTVSGRTHEISASPHPGYFGTSGFYDGTTVGVRAPCSTAIRPRRPWRSRSTPQPIP